MHNSYNQESLDKIKKNIAEEVEKHGAENICAAFDADGTLWDIDVGEIVFDHQINNWDLELPKDPWSHYKNLKKENPQSAYLWLAQILKGKNISEVLEKNKESYIEWEKTNGKLPIYVAQRELIQFLQSLKIEVFVVTASVRWSVFYGASLLNIPSKNVVGVQTHIDEDGIVTTEQKGFITYREGKAKAIEAVKTGKKLILSSGNTMGDFELLSASKNLSIAVSSANQDESLFQTEQELKTEAKNREWLHHSFR